jgi:DTW domain-containing protein YfiP
VQDAKNIEDIDVSKMKKLVVIDSTWQKAKTILRDERYVVQCVGAFSSFPSLRCSHTFVRTQGEQTALCEDQQSEDALLAVSDGGRELPGHHRG